MVRVCRAEVLSLKMLALSGCDSVETDIWIGTSRVSIASRLSYCVASSRAAVGGLSIIYIIMPCRRS